MLGTIDITIIVVYLVCLLYIGYKLSKENETQEDYFVAGRSMHWLPVALSIGATTISANGFIGAPGWAYGSGMTAFMLNFSVPLVLALVLSVFLPFLYNLKVTSCYEYIERRLGPISRTLSALGFFSTSIIQLSSMVYIPALILQKFTGWSINAIIPITVVIVVIYTLHGGLKAVIWTDAIQMAILWIGLLVIVFIAFKSLNVGFFDAISAAKDSGKLEALDFSLDLTLENGVWVALFGGTSMWLQYYTTDQSQTQRMFASKSIKALKTSILSSGIIMNVIYFTFMVVGVLTFLYYDGKNFATSNDVMIDFIQNKMPVGILGLVIIAIFSAAMSSMSGFLNSMSTVFIKDIYERFISKNQEKASLKVSMLFTGVIGVIVIFVTIAAFSGTTASILAVVGNYLSYFAGSILAVFLLAMFTKTANDKGTSIGFVLGIIVTTYIGKTTELNWLWYSLVGVTVAFVTGYFISRMLKENLKENIEEYTLMGQRAKLIRENNTMEENVSILPGSFDRYFYILIGFFFFQFIVLALMGTTASWFWYSLVGLVMVVIVGYLISRIIKTPSKKKIEELNSSAEKI